MKRKALNALLLCCLTALPASLLAADGTVKLGICISTSGSFTSVGQSTKNAVEMAKNEIDAAGGLKIGGKTYSIESEYLDNASNKSDAAANALELIGQKQVLAIVGPMSSARAIPVGEVANAFKTPMVTPWASSPLAALNRPYVFRMPVMYDIQAVSMTKFSMKEWKATKAAVLYDELSAYPTGMAKAFKKEFEAVNGPGSVVAFETFRSGDRDFGRQISAILKSGADFFYTPQHYDEVPLIVRQARTMGWEKPIAGANAWAGGDLMGQCGDACKGLYFSGNFAPGGTVGMAKTFVDSYQKLYNKLPDEPAALTYDSIKLIAQALEQVDGLSGDLMKDRDTLRTQLASIKNFEGVTGKMAYHGDGNPEKCAVMIKIDENGILTNVDKFCP